MNLGENKTIKPSAAAVGGALLDLLTACLRSLPLERACLELATAELTEETPYHPATVNSEDSFQWVSCRLKIKISQYFSASKSNQV